MNTAKAVRFNELGDASVLKIESVPVAEPGDNEIRIKVCAIGLNRAEVMFREGKYLETPQLPSGLGYEAAGIVDAVGKNISGFNVGDSVSTVPNFSMRQYGVYAEFAIVPDYAVVNSPASFSMEQSSAVWMQYLTAYGALLELGELKQGQHVLITAASSSVGVASIQLAKTLGAVVIAATRGESKKPFLLNQGADFVIQTDSEDLVSRMKEITSGKGAELIFDPVGGPLLEKLAEVATTAGQIIEYGALDAQPTPYPLFTALAKALTIRGYTLFEITQDKERLDKAKAYLLPLFEAKKLIPVIDKVFSFDQVQQAHEYMESNQQMGKIVIRL